MSQQLLDSVRVVCHSYPRLQPLEHVVRRINAFRLSNTELSLGIASKRTFLSKLNQIHQEESREGIDFHLCRFRAAVYNAVKYNYDIRVLEWWINKYRFWSYKRHEVPDIFMYALHF